MPKLQTRRERYLNTFNRKKIDRIVFSPRLYYWYYGNHLWKRPKSDKNLPGIIPKHFLGKGIMSIFDLLDASPRYPMENLFIPLYWPRKSLFNVRISWASDKDGTRITRYKTKIGTLVKKSRGGHLIEYPVKNPEDMKIMKYIQKHTKFHFLRGFYEIAKVFFRNRGVVQTFFCRSPLMTLIVDYMGFEKTVINLRRYKNETEDLMNYIDEWQDDMYKILCKSPLKILNFGENIDSNLTPPKYFEKYLVPFYEERVKQLHRSGKFCHIHMDGSIKDLLPFMSSLPFDGLEALTAKPQGDATIEEIRDSIGDKILLDGIPAVIFLPEYPIKYVRKFAQKVLELFSPRLILGISDELPPNSDFRKVEMIADMVRNYEL